MWTRVIRRHWFLTMIAGVCLILNVGLVLEIASTLRLRERIAQLELSLFLVFILVGLPVLALSVIQGIYLSSGKKFTEPTELPSLRVFRGLAVANSVVPIIFGAFTLAVRSIGYFWLP